MLLLELCLIGSGVMVMAIFRLLFHWAVNSVFLCLNLSLNQRQVRGGSPIGLEVAQSCVPLLNARLGLCSAG